MSDDPILAAIAAFRAENSALFERVLDRLTKLEADVRNLRSEHSVTRDMVMALPATVLGAIEP